MLKKKYNIYINIYIYCLTVYELNVMIPIIIINELSIFINIFITYTLKNNK